MTEAPATSATRTRSLRNAILDRIGSILPRSMDLLLRVLPAFLIIGAQRSGTTSLYSYMTSHPRIRRAEQKELHFFDQQFVKGVDWYRARFPKIRFQSGMITGEATPYYLFHPAVPERVRAVLPKARFIVMLREPISRAYSHYAVIKQRGQETLPFEEAIDREDERLRGEAEKLADPSYLSEAHQRFSYVSRGVYIDQLARWADTFPRDRILILGSEEFSAEPDAALRRVFEFVDLDPMTLESYPQRHQGKYVGDMDERTRDLLKAFYRPYNERLFEFIGRDLGWND